MRFKGRARKKIALKEGQEANSVQKVYLESILSSMTDALIVIDPDATLRSVNKATLDLLGYKEDELIGQSMKKVFLQEESMLHRYFQKIITEGVADNIGLTFLTKQGKEIPVNFSGAPMQQDGKIIGIVGVASDMRQIMAVISDLEGKKRELEEHGKDSTRMQKAMLHMMGDLDISKKEALRVSEAKYKLLAETLPQKIFIKDRNSVYIFCNKNYARDLKIEAEEIKGKTDYDFHPKELSAKYRADDKRVMESKETEEIEEKYIQEGVEKIIQTVKTPVRDEKGNVTGILGIFWDISERKEMEGQLLSAAEEWRTTFDSITDFISIHDKDFKITRVNRAFADVFKMSPQEVIGKTCYTLVHETKEPPSSCPLNQVMQTKKPISVEFFEPHLGRYLAITCSPVLDQRGEVVATVHSAKDITVHKKMEKEQHLAELGKLVADMAHEVNNPLMIISGNAQLSLMENIPNETINDNLKIIFEESKRAKDIIQRLLKFSRPSKGELQATDINKNIEAVLSIVEHQFNLANIQIKRNYADNLPSILIDEQQMREVFMNLLNNAKDAIPESGVIEVTTSLHGDFFRISFKDTGCGMSEEAMKRLFEPFFTTKEKGTGLGLSVCYGIIKAHNGELRFESELGKGTSVTILLPLKGSAMPKKM